MFSEIKRAWALWVTASQSFSSMLDGSWGYERLKNTTTKKIINKQSAFSEELAIRLQNVQIECTDALRVITSRDTEKSFFYCDPPYYNSDCGHYDGYSEADFEALLKLLASIEGKFILSSYPSDLLTRYTKAHGWCNQAIEQSVSVNAKAGNRKMKIEMLTANFELK
jgi:DNA adenine methylase